MKLFSFFKRTISFNCNKMRKNKRKTKRNGKNKTKRIKGG